MIRAPIHTLRSFRSALIAHGLAPGGWEWPAMSVLKPAYLYVASADGLVKIGFSDRPRLRVEQHNHERNLDLVLRYVVSGATYEHEAAFRRMFFSHSKPGAREWLRGPIADRLASLCDRILGGELRLRDLNPSAEDLQHHLTEHGA